MANVGNGAVVGQVNEGYTAVSANYTVVPNDGFVQVTTGSVADVIITLPAPSSPGTFSSSNPAAGVTGVGNQGQRVTIEKVDTGSNHAVISGTLNVGATYALNSKWSSATFLSDGTRWNLVASVS